MSVPVDVWRTVSVRFVSVYKSQRTLDEHLFYMLRFPYPKNTLKRIRRRRKGCPCGVERPFSGWKVDGDRSFSPGSILIFMLTPPPFVATAAELFSSLGDMRPGGDADILQRPLPGPVSLREC